MSFSLIVVELKSQTLTLFGAEKVKKQYPISSSKYGIGNRRNSYQTPLGQHFVCEKMGENAPLNGILRAGKYQGEVAENVSDVQADLITTRVLRLRGLQTGINLGGEVDSERRGIWIHGTAQESRIGSAASHGCIRLRNSDMLELYNLVEIGSRVEIIP
ncbi:MAG: L,D-transpeptidase [Candidatus Cloacimonadales bacterium]